MTKTEYYEVLGVREDKEILYSNTDDRVRALKLAKEAINKAADHGYISVLVNKVIILKECIGVLEYNQE